jgi:hypothetical protein
VTLDPYRLLAAAGLNESRTLVRILKKLLEVILKLDSVSSASRKKTPSYDASLQPQRHPKPAILAEGH